MIGFFGEHLFGLDGKGMEVLSREVRPEVGAVPPDRSIFHQAVLQKNLLSCEDILTSKDRVTGLSQNLFRNWRGISIASCSNPDQYSKSNHQNEDYRIYPPGRELLR